MKSLRLSPLIHFALGIGAVTFSFELSLLTLRRASFYLKGELFAALAVYLAAPLFFGALPALVQRWRRPAAERGGPSMGEEPSRSPALWPLALYTLFTGLSSFVIWVHGESTILGHRWRSTLALLSAVGALGALTVAHRRGLLSALRVALTGVGLWCFTIGAARLPRTLVLHVFNHRWGASLESAAELLGLIVVTCAIILWLRALYLARQRRWSLMLGCGLLLCPLAGPLPLLAPSQPGGRSQAPQAPPSLPPPSRDIFLVILDSLRADHASPELMPTLSALSRRGVTFEQAYSPSIMTRNSLPAIRSDLPPDAPPRSLSGGLRAAGYQTHLISDYPGTTLRPREAYIWSSVASHPPAHELRLTNLPYSLLALLGIGEKSLDEVNEERHPFDADGAPSYLAELSRRHPEPGLFLIHLAVPHTPYNQPPYQAKTLSEFSAEESREMNERFRLERGSGAEVDVAGRRRLYRSAVRAADEALEQILSTVAERSAQREALIIVTSDHGEPFGEHGAVGHGRSLYQPAYHVPLVIVGGGFPAGARVSAPVSGAQISPTIFESLGLPSAPRGLQRSLEGAQPPQDVAVWFPRGSMLQRGDWRLIFTERPHLLQRPKSWAHRVRFELFDLSVDPGEQRSLAAERPAKLQELIQAMRAHWLIPPQTRAALQALDAPPASP